MLVLLSLFSIFYQVRNAILQPRHSQNENKLGWSWLCSGYSHHSSLKSSLHSEITSVIMQNYNDQASTGGDDFVYYFWMSIHGDIQGDGRIPSSRICSDDRMNFLCDMHSIFFDKTHDTVLCSAALIYNREDLNCISGPVVLLSPHKPAQ